jgi:hypothetical protein
MKRLLLLPVITVLSFIIIGCPYKSRVAIDNYAKTKADKRITGYWIAKDTANPDSKVTSYYEVKDRNGFFIDIEKYDFRDTTVSDEEEITADESVESDSAIYYTEEEYREPSGIFENSISYEAFFSEIDGMMFLNLRQIDDITEFGYYIYKITFKGNNEFYLSPLTEYIKTKFKTSDELRKYIKKHKDIEFFYGDNEYYVKYDLPK